jgi:phosphoketolase
MNGPVAADELHKMNAYWRAANYLAVGQIYQAALAPPLGHDARPQFHLRAPQPRHPPA